MKWLIPDRLALKVAGLVAGGMALLMLILWIVGITVPLNASLLIVAMAGLGAFAATARIVMPRLKQADTSLRQIQRRQFENLDVLHHDHGDELDALLEQVYQTGQGIEKERDQLGRAADYRKTFLGNVSHELKTPIFAIRGFAETLLGGALNDADVNTAFVEKILRNAERLGNLANDLSDVARIETGELKMSLAAFSLLDLTREVIESVEPMAKTKDILIRCQVSSRLPKVSGDPGWIRQVLANLVDNAIKYNNPHGHIDIVARLLPDRSVKVMVTDDGIGIAPEHIHRLTERFYRVDTSRSRSQGGTGLGLAIVKHILSAHKSQLQVESQLEKGSTFSFILPTTAA